MGFWKRVDAVLVDREITRKELSVESSVPKYTIDKGIERDSEVSVEVACRICHTLQVSVESMIEPSTKEGAEVLKEKRRMENLTLKYLPVLEKLEKLTPESVQAFEHILDLLK